MNYKEALRDSKINQALRDSKINQALRDSKVKGYYGNVFGFETNSYLERGFYSRDWTTYYRPEGTFLGIVNIINNI